MFAELQVRKSLGSPHTEEADPVHFSAPAGNMALAQGALPGGCAGDLSLPLERPPPRWPAPLRHLFCCSSVICHSLPRKRGWVHTRDCSQLHKLLDATKLISNQAGCGERWEAARLGEGNAPCTGVDACSHGSSPRTLSPPRPHVSQVQGLRQWWVPAQATFQMSLFGPHEGFLYFLS